MLGDSLSHRLYTALFQRLGSDQHLEIAEFIKRSKKITLDAKIGQNLRDVVNNNPWTVESNLDSALWPDEPTWYEVDIPSRLGRDDSNSKTGFLVLPHPSGPGSYMVLTAFEAGDASARHCFAMSFINTQDVNENAYLARERYSKTPDESIERLMSVFGVSITNEFKEELLIIQDGDEAIIEAALRDAALEMPLLMAILVALNTKNGLIQQITQGATSDINLVSAPLPIRKRIGTFLDKLNRRQSSGFIRKIKPKGGAELAWYK